MMEGTPCLGSQQGRRGGEGLASEQRGTVRLQEIRGYTCLQQAICRAGRGSHSWKKALATADRRRLKAAGVRPGALLAEGLPRNRGPGCAVLSGVSGRRSPPVGGAGLGGVFQGRPWTAREATPRTGELSGSKQKGSSRRLSSSEELTSTSREIRRARRAVDPTRASLLPSEDPSSLPGASQPVGLSGDASCCSLLAESCRRES
mmetsp:Transcript_37843/g.89852  ORF Transcript_37843/g.89852 Transcript_37843/m.89852 type:complete len:204 (+) Transcript_37843:1235-1846(+)